MAPTISAIKTPYNGMVYRSKTEARWAVFFDLAGINVEYEEEGYNLPSGGYLPDFWIPELECFFEVKGSWPDNFTKQEELHTLTGRPVVVAIGYPGSKLGTLYGYRREPMSVYHTIGGFDGKAATEFVQLWGLEWTISQRLHDVDDADWGHISAIVGKSAAYQFPRWNAPTAENEPYPDPGVYHQLYGCGILQKVTTDLYGNEIAWVHWVGDGGSTMTPIRRDRVTTFLRYGQGWTNAYPSRIISPRPLKFAQDRRLRCLECEQDQPVEDFIGFRYRYQTYRTIRDDCFYCTDCERSMYNGERG